MTAADQAYHVGQAWEALPEPKRQFTFYVVMPGGDAQAFHIGPHAPALQGEDVQLVHRLWLNFRRDPGMDYLHHTDIVTYALTRLASEYARNKEETLKELRTYTHNAQRDDNILHHLPQGASGPADKYLIPAPKPQRENPDSLEE
jgi:hypothetical protein